jgi:ferredoxin
MKVDDSLCIRCGACVSVCPLDAIEATDTRVWSNERCTDCKICEKVCPLGAIVFETKI